MQTVLFHSTIFGPIHSRRLGTSLGINLMPDDGKVCTFDCLYCEAGFNAQGTGSTGLPQRPRVAAELQAKLADMSANNEALDVITFSGNGEPTLHPEFEGIIDDTIRLRDMFYPGVKVSVLSNATRLENEAVCRALRRVDNNILKLDSAIIDTVRRLDRPVSAKYDIDKVIEGIASFNSRAIVQTMLTRGSHNGIVVDNTTDEEVEALLSAYRRIRPASIMLYTIDRPTPEHSLQRISPGELNKVAAKITAATGILVEVAG